jgi:hypothetical protein
MNLATSHLRTLTRLRTTLMLFLQEALNQINSEFGFTDDRKLEFPERIVLEQPPSLKLTSQPHLPQVFLRSTGSSNPRVDLVGHEDDNLTITVSVLLSSGITSPVEDIGLRCSTLTNLICDVLLEHARTEGADRTGLYNINLQSSSSPRVETYGDLTVARCDATLDISLRYKRLDGRTKLPNFPLEDNHEPLSEAPVIEVVTPPEP